MIRCGFFDSIDEDRLYTADEMSRPYESFVSDGVFATEESAESDYFKVTAIIGSVFAVSVKPGKGIFLRKWLTSDSDIRLTLTPPHSTFNRIDSVVVRMDCTEEVRDGTIIVKTGTPSSSPTPPTLVKTSTVREYRLANIAVNHGATSITNSNITDTRSSSDCGWVTGLVSDYVLPQASSSVKGGMYLYNSTGSNTNGTMTQAAITDSLNPYPNSVYQHAINESEAKLSHRYSLGTLPEGIYIFQFSAYCEPDPITVEAIPLMGSITTADSGSDWDPDTAICASRILAENYLGSVLNMSGIIHLNEPTEIIYGITTILRKVKIEGFIRYIRLK